MKKIVGMIMAVAMMCGVFVGTTNSNVEAAQRSVSKTYTVMQSDCAIKSLNAWGKDKITLKYNTSNKRITSCSFSQNERNVFNNRMVERGGVRRSVISNKKWRYTSTWYLNFTILPPLLRTVGSKIVGAKALCALSDWGRIVKVVATYEVNGNGAITRTSYKYSFMVPSRLTGTAKSISNLFRKG